MNELSRRTLLAAGLASGLVTTAVSAVKPLKPRHDITPPDVLARDEAYWHTVAAQYDVTREVVQLENAYWGIMSRPVQAANERHQRTVNERNAFYARREFEGDMERVRQRVATLLGCAPEEIVLTRGATESLQALIGGYNRLAPGDAVLYADRKSVV